MYFSEFKKRALKDKAVKKAYDELAPEFALIEMLIEKRLSSGMTQKELAKKIGTGQPVISRLEQGMYNPSIKFLKKVAKGLNAKLVVKIV